ncbi:MAG: GAF domain-containing protein [Gaiellales bacterium]|nr:MAG: GAF domain-containing protein [Gaiellales bacterium]
MSLSRARDLWLLFIIASLGMVINAVYVLIELFSEDPFGDFRAHLVGNIFILSLLFIFPAVAYLIYYSITRHELIRSSRLLEIEVASRTRQLEDLKNFTENVMASVNDLIFVIGSDGRFHFVRGNSAMLGCELGQLEGYQFIDMVAPGSIATAVNNFERILRGEAVGPYELEIVTCDTQTRCIEISSTGYIEDGMTRAQVGVARDVTERRKLEHHALKRNRELSSLNSIATAVGKSLDLDQVLAAAMDQIAILLNADRAWVHVYNEKAHCLELRVWKGRGSVMRDHLASVSPGEGLIGRAAENDAPMAINCAGHPEMAAIGAEADLACLAVAPMKFSRRLVGVLSVSSEEPDYFSPEDLDLMRLASSQVAMAVENALLYEDLKYKTEELALQNTELAMSTEKLSHLICEAEKEQSFSVRYENPGLAKCWEIKNCTQEDCPSYESENLRCWQVAGTHCGGVVQGVFAQKFGQCEKCEVYQKARTGRLAGMGEAFNNMMAILERKVEEQRDLQSQLVQSTKLAVIGELAANVAHEINNPLTGILGYSSLLLKNLPEDDANRKNLMVIEKETLRARDIVRNLLDFSRQGSSNKCDTPVTEALESSLTLLRKQAELAGVEVDKHIGDGMLNVHADPNQLKQVFINILNNAIFAMPEGGRLTISARTIRPIGDLARVQVAFRDTGIGIPEDKLARVFEPFYTSKDVGEGTGLGLSVSRRIVEEHGGVIEVDSTVGAGSTFIVTLPTAEIQERAHDSEKEVA